MIGLVKRAVPRPVKDFLKGLGRSCRGLLAPRPAECRVRGRVIRVWVSSDLERYRAETYETKEPDTLDWLDARLRDGDVFYDVGANIGLYSLYAAAIRPSAAVYAFEPDPLNLAQLCRNVSSNGFERVLPSGVALSGAEAVEPIFLSGLEPGGAFNSLKGPSALRWDASAPTLRVAVFSAGLDALVERWGLPPPALLKLDVDGLELDILRGAAKTLASGKVRSVLVELNGPWGSDPADEARRLLEERGFRLAGEGAAAVLSTGEPSRNCVFDRA